MMHMRQSISAFLLRTTSTSTSASASTRSWSTASSCSPIGASSRVSPPNTIGQLCKSSWRARSPLTGLHMQTRNGNSSHGNSSRPFSSSAALSKQASGADILGSFASPQHGTNVETAMESLARADAVCFDVDSTVISEEGIDVLADFLGKGEAVAELTRQAMEGDTKFQDALAARLQLLEPSKQSIDDCLNATPLQLTPGIESLVETLHEFHKDVYLVSGGFRVMIEPVAKAICVAKTNIYANTILWDDDGNYVGFDDTEPTSSDMGKPKALDLIQAANEYKCMIMIGDGATDAQAKPPAKAFIGFGGVVARRPVKEKACWFVTDFGDLERVVREYSGRS